MFDYSVVRDQAIAKRVQKEAHDFMKLCHFGCQGIGKTESDVVAAINRLIQSGYLLKAFDTEIVYVPLVKSLLPKDIPIHSAVSYPMGRGLLKQKLYDLQWVHNAGVTDTCLSIDWQAIFSGRYSDIEKECRVVMAEYGGSFLKLAFIIPATLMSDTEIVETCKAMDQAGVVSIKVNPGAGLGVTFEEVALIRRVFPRRFDIHPSGNIRSLGEVERYLEMGCDNIHTVRSLDIVEDFIVKQLLKYGGIS